MSKQHKSALVIRGKITDGIDEMMRALEAGRPLSGRYSTLRRRRVLVQYFLDSYCH